MFRQSIRRFGTTALRAATEGASSYTARVSTAQGVVHGLTEGMSFNMARGLVSNEYRLRSNWQHPSYSFEAIV